jgi:DNA processing protein
MNYSDISLKVLAAKECGLLKSNAQFWSSYSTLEKFTSEIANLETVDRISERLKFEFDSNNDESGIVCAFDDDFPVINRNVKNNSDKPFLLFYKGDLSLLSDLNLNVAVIGLTSPDSEIIRRESEIVMKLVENDLVIVSGLAAGCDAVGHKVCLESNGKTIAILPTQLNKVYPLENKELAEEIVEKGGLLLTEYYKEPTSKHEAVGRFIERDRLQALFSKAIVLIASYRKGEGDSGSRHAMEAAKKFGINRFVMYNDESDAENSQFALNRDFLSQEQDERLQILKPSSIDFMRNLVNPNLIPGDDNNTFQELTLF